MWVKPVTNAAIELAVMPPPQLPTVSAAQRAADRGNRIRADAAGDERLAIDFAAGDREAAEVVVAQFTPRIASLVHRLLAWRQEVDDVVQDVFVAALAKRHKFRGKSKLETWLVRIAINQCRAYQRKKWLRRRLFAAWSANVAEGHDQHSIDAVLTTTEEASRHHTPDEESVANEEAAAIRCAVAELPQKYREVIVLYYLEQFSAAEVAEALNLRQNTVEVQLVRARKILQQQLTGYGPSES